MTTTTLASTGTERTSRTTTTLTTTGTERDSRTTGAPARTGPTTATRQATATPWTAAAPSVSRSAPGTPTISVPVVATRTETRGAATCTRDEHLCDGVCGCGDGAADAAPPGGDRAPRPLADGARRRWGRVLAPGDDAGMATAEYAIAMIAAVGFAGLLVAVLTSATVRELLTGLVTSALSHG